MYSTTTGTTSGRTIVTPKWGLELRPEVGCASTGLSRSARGRGDGFKVRLWRARSRRSYPQRPRESRRRSTTGSSPPVADVLWKIFLPAACQAIAQDELGKVHVARRWIAQDDARAVRPA